MSSGDDVLWKFLKGTPAKPPVVELSYQELLDGQRRLVEAERPQANNPAVDPGTQAPAPQMLVKKGGVIYAQAGVCLQFGVAKQLANRAQSIHDMIPLTDKQVAKLTRKVAAAAQDLDDTGTGNGTPKSTAASALKSSMREGRQPAGGKYPFARAMRTAKGGGLVEASRNNDGRSPYSSRQAMPRAINTPSDYSAWEALKETSLHKLMMRQVRATDNG